MAATYTMQEMKDLHNENETILYPRMIIKGQCSTEELIEDIAHHTTYNTGELRGMIMALKDAMAREMSRGYSVKGKEAEQPAGETRRNARSIKIRNINFRADKELIRKTEGHCTLERESGTSKLKTSRHSSEKRLTMAQDFLTTHPYMTVADYMALTGLSHTTAARELQKWGKTPETGILPKGQRTHRVYVAATAKEKD